ncbi:MAG: hypothetical protein QM498_02900 [Desulfobacterium sp.]
METLCEGLLEGDIRIHRSVMERMNHRTANYAPGQIPKQFVVVESDMQTPPEPRNFGNTLEWDNIRANIDQWVLKRKKLYGVMLTFTLVVLLAACLLKLPIFKNSNGNSLQ